MFVIFEDRTSRKRLLFDVVECHRQYTYMLAWRPSLLPLWKIGVRRIRGWVYLTLSEYNYLALPIHSLYYNLCIILPWQSQWPPMQLPQAALLAQALRTAAATATIIQGTVEASAIMEYLQRTP